MLFSQSEGGQFQLFPQQSQTLPTRRRVAAHTLVTLINFIAFQSSVLELLAMRKALPVLTVWAFLMSADSVAQ